VKGAKLQLQLQFLREIFKFAVTIEHVFSPFTMAAAMKVRFDENPPFPIQGKKGDIAALKMYDRQFATGAQQAATGFQYDEGDLTYREAEEEYQQDIIHNPPTSENNTNEHGAKCDDVGSTQNEDNHQAVVFNREDGSSQGDRVDEDQESVQNRGEDLDEEREVEEKENEDGDTLGKEDEGKDVGEKANNAEELYDNRSHRE
jgi:hypothetical protein